MKGKWLHNRILIEPLLQAAGSTATIHLEMRVDQVQRSRSVDAVLDWPGFRVALEAENKATTRLERDVIKAQDIKAHLLLIVVPNWRVVRSVQTALRRMQADGIALRILVLTQGAARQWLTNQSHLMSRSYVLRTSDNKPQQPLSTNERSPQ